MTEMANYGINGIDGTAANGGLLSLATGILQQTKDIINHLAANNLAEPTFMAGTLDIPESPEYATIRTKLKTSLEDLGRLIEGPKRQLRALACQGYDLAAFQVGLEFGFFAIVPAENEISFSSLAEKAGLDLDRVTRIVRVMITHRFFQEHRPGFVSHTANSYALHSDEDLHSMVAYS